jgi:DNA-binding protein YbaB
MVNRRDLSNSDEWIGEWLSSISARAAQAQQLSEQVARVTVSASSPDGAIEVKVCSSGALADLRLAETVKAWPAQKIAAEILAVTRAAQSKLAARVAEMAARTVGEQSPAAEALVEGLKLNFGTKNHRQ